tara:strand:+ start:813 stop:1733 length:921 start_codon:yes stop_codon:yes gene_type:complete
MRRNKYKERKVAVLMGGMSSEREISILSGRECGKSLREIGFDVIEIDPSYDIVNDLKKYDPEIVFNALHGSWGEDGNVQSILEYLGIKYTHSGVLSSALAMNKIISKKIFAEHEIPIAKTFNLLKPDLSKINFPIIIKPVNGGSSIGLEIIEDKYMLLDYIKNNKKQIMNVFAEEYVEGIDLSCAIMGDQVLDVAEIVMDGRLFDYNAKYISKNTKHLIPANIKPNVYEDLKEYALRAHKCLNCKGVTRVDFRYMNSLQHERLVCLEINTQPGMTKKSILPDIASYTGIKFDELIKWITQDASINR